MGSEDGGSECGALGRETQVGDKSQYGERVGKFKMLTFPKVDSRCPWPETDND